MHSNILVLSSTLLSTVVGFMNFPNRWVRHCREGQTRAIRQANCDELGLQGMESCLMSTHDRTLSALIRRCPNQLPQAERFDQFAKRLYQANLPRAFRAYITRRCSNLSNATMRELLDSFVNNNAVPFVRAVMQHCVVGEEGWRRFAKQAQMQGKNELLVVLRAGPSKSGQAQGQFGQNRSWGMSYSMKRDTHTMPSGEKFVVSKQETSRDPNSADPMAPGTQNDSGKQGQEGVSRATGKFAYMRVTTQQVASNLNILGKLTKKQAESFGIISDGCSALTEAHFRQPTVSPWVVKSLPLNCFKRIPPPAFAGLSPAMIQQIEWWPFISRDQIRYVPTGDAIRALPFDQLGKGRQRDKEDREHPCWTITRDQMRSIRHSRSVLKEYNRRCVKSGGISSVIMSISTLVAATCLTTFILTI